VTRADWTYQVPEAGTGATGLEDYVVESADGELVGRVIGLLRRDGDVYVAVNRGTPPVTRELRAIPWDAVASVDHADLALRLRLEEPAVGETLELDPANAVEGEDADAVRLTELPPELAASSRPDEPGPVDRLSYGAALAIGALGFLLLLGLILFASEFELDWKLALFAVPAALLAVSGWLALRVYRAPYER
jgi:hypothetical protein